MVKSKICNCLRNKTTCKLLSIYHNSCLLLRVLEGELEYAEAATISGAVKIDADVSDLSDDEDAEKETEEEEGALLGHDGDTTTVAAHLEISLLLLDCIVWFVKRKVWLYM